MTDFDRWLKRLWLVVGILLLVTLLFAGGAIAFSFFEGWRGERRVALPAPDSKRATGADLHAIRYTLPGDVWGATTQIVIVKHGSNDLNEGSSYGLYGGSEGPSTNVVFLDRSGESGRLLFERPVYIVAVDYPQGESDSLQRWISYSVVLEDADGDGTLDQEDLGTLFVSDLEGRGLRRVLPDGWYLLSHHATLDQRRLVVYALRAADGKKWAPEKLEQRSFVYDLATQTLSPSGALDSLTRRAAEIVSPAKR